MGVEVVESELAQVSVESVNVENGSVLNEKENGKTNQGLGVNEPIKFGSHSQDEQAKGEVKNAPETNFPRDAVDEWPAPKQVHYFHIVKYRSYEDPKVKAKAEQGDKGLQKITQSRSQLIEKLRARRAARAEVIALMRSLNEEHKQFRAILDEKHRELEPLRQALGNLKEKGGGVHSSEKELNDYIKSLEYRIQHESIPLTEEKQILREIKQLEATRGKVIANADARAQIQKSMGEKQSIQDQVKVMGVDMDGVRKDHQVVKLKRKQLEEQKEVIDKEIMALEKELDDLSEKRNEGYKHLHELRRQREEGNASYYQNRTLLNKAKELAAKKDIEALKVICDTEVDKFMSQWSNSKAFRDDYERRILSSLDFRQLSRDGRMRNPDEKPLVPATPSGIESVVKPDVKRAKEDSSISPPLPDSATTQKAQKEVNGKVQKEVKSKPRGTGATLEPVEIEDEERISVEAVEKVQKDPRPKEKEVDEAKLREMRREEEIAKAKLAMDRKKKQAEKAAAKAALKAQKEAEKKLKDREKKAKKKAAALGSAPDLEEPTDQAEAEEVAEPEKAEEKVESSVPSKNRDRKENGIRQRSRAKGPESLAKIILKRKKSTKYWVWAVPAAAILVVMLVVLGYNYLL